MRTTQDYCAATKTMPAHIYANNSSSRNLVFAFIFKFCFKVSAFHFSLHSKCMSEYTTRYKLYMLIIRHSLTEGQKDTGRIHKYTHTHVCAMCAQNLLTNTCTCTYTHTHQPKYYYSELQL